MSYELIIFTDPKEVKGFLQNDGNLKVTAHSAVHSTGREGIGFTIPDDTPNLNGARVILEASGKVSINQKGILILRTQDMENRYPWGAGQTAAIAMDDFTLQNKVVSPPLPFPIPPKPSTPLEIINDTYRTGSYNLGTKEGCGKFTEDCVRNLHVIRSIEYGHIKKVGAQNQYNGHAVDALMLLERDKDTEAGIYDIILATESPEAKPQFIHRGPPVSELWYYPA